jgi:hypothetical protein
MGPQTESFSQRAQGSLSGKYIAVGIHDLASDSSLSVLSALSERILILMNAMPARSCRTKMLRKQYHELASKGAS